MNAEQGLIFIETSGVSMRPFLWSGEKVIVKKTNDTELNRGDLVIFRLEGNLFCHRFLCKRIINNRMVFLMRGDCNPTGKEEIFYEQIVGKVVGILKGEKVIDLTAWKWQLMNHAALLLAPLTSRMIQWAFSIKKIFK